MLTSLPVIEHPNGGIDSYGVTKNTFYLRSSTNSLVQLI